MSAAANTSNQNSCATASRIRPARVEAMPYAIEYGRGRLSATMPTTGCSSEAVNWNVRVSQPTCWKVRPKSSFSMG